MLEYMKANMKPGDNFGLAYADGSVLDCKLVQFGDGFVVVTHPDGDTGVICGEMFRAGRIEFGPGIDRVFGEKRKQARQSAGGIRDFMAALASEMDDEPDDAEPALSDAEQEEIIAAHDGARAG